MINAFFIMQLYRLLRLITVRIYTVYSVKGQRDFPCMHTITKIAPGTLYECLLV